MSAETHLEVYRRFQGTLSEHPLRFMPLWTTGLRTALKQRKALFLLYLPPLIATVIVSFVVYLKFATVEVSENAREGMGFEEQLVQGLVVGQIQQMLDVVRIILEFSKGMGMFALLAVAWFASGLFCEDRKAGAHQLYFARPITRLDYALGKFLIAATFSLLAMLAPVLIILLMASLFSPEWSFLKDEWDVIPRAVGFACLWTVVVCTLVLLASSLASRRSFALLGVFAYVMLSAPIGGQLGHSVNPNLYSLAFLINLDTLAQHVFGQLGADPQMPAGPAWTAATALVVVGWAVIWMRLRRLEVVA